MKFIIVRHTTTDWNLAKRIQGRVNTSLNEQGRNEAKKLAEKLAKFNISRIVCSDLARAKQTAEIINEKLNLPLYFNKGLRECSFGELEGMTREETIIKYGEK
jgi:broad specificity phosphatase PhoE